MPRRLSPGDVKLVWASAIIGILLLAGTALMSPPQQGNDSPIPSSYSPDPDGALAAYLLLRDLDVPVLRTEQSPVASLPEDPYDFLLIIAEPSEFPNTAEKRALLDFVENGGRILFCGRGLELFLPLPPTAPAFGYADRTFGSRIPSRYTRRADTIMIDPRSRWSTETAGGLPLYGSDAEPVVTVSQIGEGEVLWWAAATPLTNRAIAEHGNLNLFLNTVSGEGGPDVVFWDEYFHGQQGSLWSYLQKTPVAWSLWQFAILIGVVLFGFSRRRGPIVEPRAVSRLSPLEFVETMGDLYARAGAASVAVEVPYKRLRLELARQLGRSPGIADAELAKAASQRFPVSEAELRDTLELASQAAGQPRFPAKRALELVRKLVDYSNKMTARRPLSIPQEKNS